MKTLAQNLKQAFDALEFTNASNLTVLKTMLHPEVQGATKAPTESRTERHNHSLDQITGATAASH